MLYLAMNLPDIIMLDSGKMALFPVPLTKKGNPYRIGDVIGIKEPFKKIRCHIDRYENGKTIDEDNIIGVRYRFDSAMAWECGVTPPNNEFYLSTIADAEHWSAARTMPEFAVRRHIHIVKAEEKSLEEFTDEDICQMHLNYNPTDNQQTIIKEYLPAKNHGLFLDWWRNHYKATMKECDTPMAIALYIKPAETLR